MNTFVLFILLFLSSSAMYAQRLTQHKENLPGDCSVLLCSTRTLQIAQVTPALSAQPQLFFSSLLDTQSWPARWSCGRWLPFAGWLYIVSDLVIWFSYFMIPIALGFFVIKRKNEFLQFRLVALLFIIFILSCGLTHLIDVAIFWWPAYNLSALLRFVTATVSLSTVFALVYIAPKILDFKSPQVLEDIVEQRTSELNHINQLLQEEIKSRQRTELELTLLNEKLQLKSEGLAQSNAELIKSQEASLQDNKERKRAEERFRLVVESAPNAMVLINSKGTITLVNNKTELLFDYNRDELIGAPLEILIPDRFLQHHPDQRTGFFASPKTRMMGVGRDLFAKRKDGTEIQVEIGLNPIETADGPLALATIIDITERKLREKAVKIQLELQVKNKELQQFAYLASHDLQEPLRTVSNYMKVLEEDYHHLLDNDAIRYLTAINGATTRMSMLINALLDFSRLGHNKKLAKVKGSELIEMVTSDLQNIIRTSGAVISIGDLPEMNAYETELRQLFQNLITNAIKFQKKNVRPEIQISVKEAPGEYRFSVSDNGIGIAPHHYERVFEMFQRLHSQHEYEGSGIGLANCKKIVELHQGEIWIESTVGQGTTFHFTIPHLHQSLQ